MSNMSSVQTSTGALRGLRTDASDEDSEMLCRSMGESMSLVWN